MAVFRVEKNHNYTVMSNYHLRDTTLDVYKRQAQISAIVFDGQSQIFSGDKAGVVKIYSIENQSWGDTCLLYTSMLDLPLDEIMFMGIGRAVVFRAGEKPVIAQRYDTLSDPLYQKMCIRDRCTKGLPGLLPEGHIFRLSP